jgi:hypothetical protein
VGRLGAAPELGLSIRHRSRAAPPIGRGAEDTEARPPAPRRVVRSSGAPASVGYLAWSRTPRLACCGLARDVPRGTFVPSYLGLGGAVLIMWISRGNLAKQLGFRVQIPKFLPCGTSVTGHLMRSLFLARLGMDGRIIHVKVTSDHSSPGTSFRHEKGPLGEAPRRSPASPQSGRFSVGRRPVSHARNGQ